MYGSLCIAFVSLRHRALSDCVNFTNFAFWINCHFNTGILFHGIVILSCDPYVFSINC